MNEQKSSKRYFFYNTQTLISKEEECTLPSIFQVCWQKDETNGGSSLFAALVELHFCKSPQVGSLSAHKLEFGRPLQQGHGGMISLMWPTNEQ